MQYLKNMQILIILFLAAIAGFSLLKPGLPPTHDGEYHIIRFYEFDKVLRGGEIYPRWAPDLNNGYGVPLFNYVYPLPNYVASLLHAFGLSFIDAFKLNMFFALLLGALLMYCWARLYWGANGGMIASVFYTWAPYHFLDIYIRGSIGEVWALAFFPGFLWAIEIFTRTGKNIYVPISAVFLLLIIFSHNILALMFFPFAICYMILLIFHAKDKKKLALKFITIVVLGLGLTSIFWFPAILEREYVAGLDVFDYHRHFAQFYELIFPSWGSGFSQDISTQGLSFQIGVANLIVIGSIVISLIIIKKQREKRITFFMLGWIILSIFFILEVSMPIWMKIPFIQYFQFPWRFLSIVILCCSFLAGGVFGLRLPKLAFFTFLFLPVVFGIAYSQPAYYHMRDDNYYISRSNFIDSTNSPGDAFNTVWFNNSLAKATKLIEDEGDSIKINVAYFPGWQVFVDGNRVDTNPNADGLIEAKRTESGGFIEVRFLDTQIRTFANSITLISLGILSLLLMKSFSVRMRKKP